MIELFEAGKFREDTDVLIGNVRDEMSMFQWGIDIAGSVVEYPWSRYFSNLPPFVGRIGRQLNGFIYRQLIRAIFGSMAPLVLKRYPPSTVSSKRFLLQNLDAYSNRIIAQETAFNWDQYYRMLSDYIFHCPSRLIENRLAESSSSVFAYAFEFQPEFLDDLGGICATSHICHAVELPYVFHSGMTVITFTPDEQKVSDGMISHWVGFASSLEFKFNELRPDETFNFSTASPWKTFRADSHNVMQINRTWETTARYREDICDLWDEIGYDY